ncbi:MAG: ABC transporter permease, partial [Pseudomonas sp.]|uniref:ABC transporter permease n=1 Tax=Pseudomonas sp. TaxID=306 RepID=UPI0030F36B54
MLNGYGSTILDGAWLTISLALTSMALAIVLGLIGAAFRLSPIKWLALLGEAYATVIRGIPDLVLILLIFYGGQDVVNRVAPLLGFEDYIDLDPFSTGVFTMGFIFGAYLSETFRGAFMAIPKGQSEAGAAYGMSGTQVFFRVLVPQMIRFAIPGFTNNWLVLTKATALISVVGLQDMMFKAKNAADATHQP